MTRHALLLSLALATAASAQDAALAETADAFERDLALVTRVASTLALAHDASGAFPATSFGVLGSRFGQATALRTQPLTALDVTPAGDGVEVVYVPLPVDPYVSDDRVVTLRLRPDGPDRYRGTYEITRRRDPDAGGAALPYDVAGPYRVGRAFGSLCVEASRVQALVASGTFVPDPTLVSSEPLTVRVHPPGEPTPVYYERTEASR